MELDYFDGIQMHYAHERYSIRNKWTSVCHSLDFVKDSWKMAINGDTNATYLYRHNVPLKEKFSDNASMPLVIRLGHYFFDDKPIIGKIVDFNVWDRSVLWLLSLSKIV